MELTEFLVARIAENEAVARRVIERTDRYVGCDLSKFMGDDYTLYEHDGAVTSTCTRVLAECEAKRRIVDDIVTQGYLDDQYTTDGLAWRVLRDLALPYADHQDCHPDWRA